MTAWVVAGGFGRRRGSVRDECCLRALRRSPTTGIILKELAVRGLARRILILTPASLVTQWVDELEQVLRDVHPDRITRGVGRHRARSPPTTAPGRTPTLRHSFATAGTS
jgi:hypothetical protein